MVRKLIVIMVCLLLVASSGCSKNPYQFALDAVAAKPAFDRDKETWAVTFSQKDDSLSMELLRDYFGKANRQAIRPQEGSIIVCWTNKDTRVTQLTSFDPATQAEQATISTLFPDCQ